MDDAKQASSMSNCDSTVYSSAPDGEAVLDVLPDSLTARVSSLDDLADQVEDGKVYFVIDLSMVITPQAIDAHFGDGSFHVHTSDDLV